MDELKSNNARNGNLDGYVRRTVSDKAINLFNWIDWVVLESLPFSAVETRGWDAEVFKPTANNRRHPDEVHGATEPKSSGKVERLCS